MKTHLVVVGGGGGEHQRVETGGGYSGDMRTVTGEGKQKPITCIDASLTQDFRCKEESNNKICTYFVRNVQYI